jgi:transposase
MDRVYVKRKRNESLVPGCTRRTLKYRGGGVGVSFWASVSFFGGGSIVFYDGQMNSSKYIALLRSNLRRNATTAGLDERFTLVQDPAPYHASGVAKRFYERESIDSLILPGNSPDLNVIEQVSKELKRRVFREHRRFTSVETLKRRIKSEWRTLARDLEFLRKLIVPYRRRLEAVLRNNGYNSKY